MRFPGPTHPIIGFEHEDEAKQYLQDFFARENREEVLPRRDSITFRELSAAARVILSEGRMDQSDEELLTNARRGSNAAWAELFDRHQGRIYRFALRMTGSSGVADEVVQDTFLDLLRGGLRFDAGKGSLGAFLLGVARLKSLRLGSRSGRTDSDDRVLGGLEAPADPALDVETRERHRALQGAILSLPEQFREAVVLCELTELSYEEAAAVMGCPVGTVRSRLHRARHMLLERLVEKGIHGVH